jgi:2-oxoisovalerate dehydrogenase E1 component
MPATPADAKGLMKTALRAGDPVIILESKALFASKGEVPVGDHLVPFGLARIARAGRDLTIASAGQLVHRALEAAERLASEGIECEVIDLRTIMPLDVATVAASVGKTHRLLIADEGYAMCGVGAELGQAMNELAFDELDAPVARLHTEPVVHPLAPALERAILVDADKIVAAAHAVIAGRPPVPWHWRAATGLAPVGASVPSPRAAAAEPAASRSDRLKAEEPLEGEAITMPFGDLTISEGKIVRWAKAVGDSVKAGELVAEIETDKAVVEIEAPVAGVLAQIAEPVGSVVKMGGRIGTIRPSQ